MRDPGTAELPSVTVIAQVEHTPADIFGALRKKLLNIVAIDIGSATAGEIELNRGEAIETAKADPAIKRHFDVSVDLS